MRTLKLCVLLIVWQSPCDVVFFLLGLIYWLESMGLGAEGGWLYMESEAEDLQLYRHRSLVCLWNPYCERLDDVVVWNK